MSSQASNQDKHAPNMPDLSAYGIAANGEPAGTTNPMGERVAAMPFQRRLEFRKNKDGKLFLKDLVEKGRNTAAWVQTRGIQVPQPCSYCSAGNGPFTACVVLRMPNGQRFSDGSCANCYFGQGGSRCSFRERERASSPKVSSDKLLGQFQSVRSKSDYQAQVESTKTGSTPNEGPNKRRRMNNPMSSVDLLSPLFVPVDESDSINGRPAADSARDDSVSRDPRVRPAAQKENTGRATPIIDTNPPPHAPRGPKDMKHTTTKNDTSSKMASKPIQSEGSDPRVICGFLESSLEPRTPPLNSADNENSTAPDDTSANSEPAQSRHEPSGEDNAKKTSMPNPRLVDSSKRENMIKCPLTPTMYNDAGQLRHAVKDLSKYLHVAERRLKELEQFSNKDVWEMAISKLDK